MTGPAAQANRGWLFLEANDFFLFISFLLSCLNKEIYNGEIDCDLHYSNQSKNRGEKSLYTA